MIKKGDYYFPPEDLKKEAWIKSGEIYQEAAKNAQKFWEKLAGELKWSQKWIKAFEHHPPYFKWFVGGKLNITENALDENLAKRKDKVALIWEPEPPEEKAKTLTYHELYQEVNQFANALKKLGVEKGDRVGIYLPMIPEAIVALLACARIGAVHNVVFSAFSSTALKVRLEDAQAKILITADGFYRRGKVISLKDNADEGIKGTTVEKIIVVKRAGNEIPWDKSKDLWYHDLLKAATAFCPPEAMDSEDLFFILYTSGSTGKPKGCVHTCGGYAVQAKFSGKWIFDWKENDVFWSTADLGWITGHTYSCYAPLLNGTTYLIYEGAPDWPTPERWAQIIEKHQVTIFYTAPTAIRMFEKYGDEILKKYQFKSLRLLGSVGEPIDEAAWLWYFENIGKKRCPILDTWWQTETGGILITSLPGLGPFRPAFTGLPFPGIKFDIVDDEGNSCPPEKEGYLIIRPPFNPGLVRGVYKNPKKYLEAYWSKFGPSIYYTSDGAFKDKKGLIRIVGRMDDVIKVAGHRLTIGELEAAINLHPDITECAVVGVPDQIRGQMPVAFVTLIKERESEEVKKEIIALIRKEIGPVAAMKEIFLLEDLPKTRSGKIMRRILRKLFAGESLGDLSTLANPEAVEGARQVIKQSTG